MVTPVTLSLEQSFIHAGQLLCLFSSMMACFTFQLDWAKGCLGR